MKKLHFFVIKSFLRPFAATFFIVLFILMMLFLFQYIDEFVGKGIDWFTVAKLIFYANASNIPPALPLAILLASIMCFGAMAENHELVAIKASGISFARAMLPLLLIMAGLALFTFFFANTIIPQTKLKMTAILTEFRQTKPSFLIPEGVFYNGIDGYSIKVRRKDEATQTLYGILLYDHTKNNGNVNVLRAAEGKMYKSPDEQYLILKLKDGVRYEEMQEERGAGRQRLLRVRFRELEHEFMLSGFDMAEINEGIFSGHYQFLNIGQLRSGIDSLNRDREKIQRHLFNTIKPYYNYFNRSDLTGGKKAGAAELEHSGPGHADFLENIEEQERLSVLQSALGRMHTIRSETLSAAENDREKYKRIKHYLIEYHRKFALAAACFVLFFIGAPLGAIIRKGGLGMPVVIAILFFLIYYITGMIGENAAREGDWAPVLGMWLSAALLIPAGMFLIFKANQNASFSDFDRYLKFFRK